MSGHVNGRAADYFHPAVTFSYIIALTVMAMLFFHPAFIAIGIAFAVFQGVILCGAKKVLRQLAWSVPLCLVIAAFNPLVSHGGKTLLFYLFDNPVTLEATLYGAYSGSLLLLVFLWFGVYNRLVTPDKFMYLFSRVAPAASMLVTMTQRMIPLFSRRIALISATQKTLPGADKRGRFGKKFGTGLKEISILLSWSMEEGLDTADSMKARGYGCERRSTFSIYRFTRRDAAALVFIAALSVLCVAGYYSSVSVTFYPRIRLSLGAGGIVSAAALALLAGALPIAEGYWSLIWRLSDKRINAPEKMPAAILEKGVNNAGSNRF